MRKKERGDYGSIEAENSPEWSLSIKLRWQKWSREPGSCILSDAIWTCLEPFL